MRLIPGNPPLIITNGDAAADHFKHCGFDYPVLPWRDVLHDGPVPALPLQDLSEIRSLFIASQSWGHLEEVRHGFRERDRTLQGLSGSDKVVLWFEHDLYDQLQLMQVVHELGQLESLPEISTILCKPHITTFDESSTRGLFEAKKPLTEAQIELATTVWMAFTLGDYEALNCYSLEMDGEFPHLSTALVRWMEEFPWTENGLNRTENQIVDRLLEHQRQDPVELFKANLKLEEAVFLGDSSFWSYLENLAQRKILQTEEHKEFLPPWKCSEREQFSKQALSLTAAVRHRLESNQPLEMGPGLEPDFSRWMGGRLLGAQNPWWWDNHRQRLVQS